MHMVINKTNQILDFDERHCINEYKSAYVLRCRSTNKTLLTSNDIIVYLITVITLDAVKIIVSSIRAGLCFNRRTNGFVYEPQL